MDDTRSFSGDAGMDRDFPAYEEPVMDLPPVIEDERRMHVRAYNYWVSLLDGRPYPLIDDLNPANIDDFSPHSVLLDFTSGPDDAAIPYLGSALRSEGGIEGDIHSIADVPPRSVLSRLTDHYLQIIANRAPIGFEAEYTNARGRPTMYRGILMPFSSDGDSIDFIYGVINWKEVAEDPVSEDIHEAVTAALANPHSGPATTPIWADGPNAQPVPSPFGEERLTFTLSDDAPLYDRLAIARESVESLVSCDQRSRAALYDALGKAYDFALAADMEPANYAEILEDAGLIVQDRAPMTPIVKLIFGIGYDKTRLAEYAAVLNHGRRNELLLGALPDFLESFAGGLKGVVKAERAFRRPAGKADKGAVALAKLADMPALAFLTLDTPAAAGEFVNLIGRREADGSLAIISAVSADQAMLSRLAKRTADTKSD